MKNIAALMAVILMISFAIHYARRVIRKEIDPALSTWLIFLTGAIISLGSYIVSEGRDFITGVQNTIDLVIIIIIIISIILIKKSFKIYLEKFEKKYLIMANLILLFWIITGNAFIANVLTQILMTWAYLPTFHKLIINKKNTESFGAWAWVLTAQIFSLYTAFTEGNVLAQVYVIRAEFMTLVLYIMMIYYHFKDKRMKYFN